MIKDYDDEEFDESLGEYTEAEMALRNFSCELKKACVILRSDFESIKRANTYNPSDMKKAFRKNISELNDIRDSYEDESKPQDGGMLEREMWSPLINLIKDLTAFAESVEQDRSPSDMSVAERVSFCEGILKLADTAVDGTKKHITPIMAQTQICIWMIVKINNPCNRFYIFK